MRSKKEIVKINQPSIHPLVALTNTTNRKLKTVNQWKMPRGTQISFRRLNLLPRKIVIVADIRPIIR